MSATASASRPVRWDWRDRAMALGTYPTWAAASRTLRVVSLPPPSPLSTRDAEAMETPASAATVRTVGAASAAGCKRLRLTLWGSFGLVNVFRQSGYRSRACQGV